MLTRSTRSTKRVHAGRLVTVAFLLAASGASTSIACGPAPQRGGPGYPAREPGCEVAVFADVPPQPTDNIGPVSAKCSADISKEDCLRTLKDQACKVGGDTLWGVNDQPELKDGKIYLYGRAAHKK